MTDKNQNPIGCVFEELKSKGHIAKNRKLVSRKAKWPLDFASDWVRPRIYYNELHSCLEDNLLRIALLHEEGHLTAPYAAKIWSRMSIVGALIFAVAIAILFVCLETYLVILLMVPTFIMSLNLSQRLFRTALGKEETRADMHAARILFTESGITRPSFVAACLFEILRNRPRDRTSGRYRLKKFLSVEFHPSDKERIKAILVLEESLVKVDGV